MFGIFAPITYNTNLNSFLGSYYSPYYSGYSPFASLFNQASYYGGMSMGYPYINNYGYNNYYPNVFVMNYASSSGYGGYSANTGYSSPVRYSSPSSAVSAAAVVTNPVKVTSGSTVQQSAKPTATNNLEQEIISVARKYINCNERDGSHLKFCVNPTCRREDPFNEEWCTDFVTYVVKEAYANKGEVLPVGFGDHDVKTMKNWAIDNGCFIRTSNKSQKGKFIAKNIKQGDIMVINENNYSHIGFVTKVDSNGVIHTIEGNRDDRVKEFSYSPNYPNLSGFIRLTS